MKVQQALARHNGLEFRVEAWSTGYEPDGVDAGADVTEARVDLEDLDYDDEGRMVPVAWLHYPELAYLDPALDLPREWVDRHRDELVSAAHAEADWEEVRP